MPAAMRLEAKAPWPWMRLCPFRTDARARSEGCGALGVRRVDLRCGACGILSRCFLLLVGEMRFSCGSWSFWGAFCILFLVCFCFLF